MTEQIIYTAAANFEAARQVSLLPEGHRSRRLHGHSFLAKIRTKLSVNEIKFPGAGVGDLRGLLENAVSPLDYRLLNELLDQPTDENIARLLRTNLKLPGMEAIGVQSTKHEGVDLEKNDNAHVWRRYTFEAAHQLPNVPQGHKCGRMHGHGFEIILHASQGVSGQEIGIDYDRLDALWAPIYKKLNYKCLNEISGLENPTSELISSWIWGELKPYLPELSWVTVYETASCGAHFDGSNYRIWKEMTIDSAVQLKSAPTQDHRHSIHGHTFTLRLHLAAPLDKVMGWTMDFGDLKSLFNPIFLQLDHQPLFGNIEIPDTDCASLAQWIRARTLAEIPEIDRIDLFETGGSGVILSVADIAPALPV